MPSEFCCVYEVRLHECCSGRHSTVVLTPKFHVIPDECSDVAELVHDDLAIIVLGPFGETGANVDGKDAPIIHDIADIVGGGAVALKGSVLDHVHCEWLPPVGHFSQWRTSSVMLEMSLEVLPVAKSIRGSDQIGCCVRRRQGLCR